MKQKVSQIAIHFYVKPFHKRVSFLPKMSIHLPTTNVLACRNTD